MNTKNLILTPVSGMNREEWLQWRQPLFHVENFIIKMNGGTGWRQRESCEQFLKILFQTDNWKEFVFPCIGGCEIASVVGLNPYQSVIELFYEKVGLKDFYREENTFMFYGKRMEEFIAEMWQYWEDSEEKMMQNFNDERIVRKCRRLNYYAQNKAFPFLFVSVDRLINKHTQGDESKEEGALELKQIGSFAAQKWENGIPPMYVAQNQQQLLVLELVYGELAIFKDGRNMDVFPFDYHEAICNRLKAEGQEFFNRVKKGIEFHLLYQATGDKNYLAEIDKLSPEPDGSISYQNFLKENYKDRGGEMIGGEVELHLAKSYVSCNQKIKEIEQIKLEASNKLQAAMKENSMIDFGQAGKATWRANSKGVRSFRVDVKVEEGFTPDPEILKSLAEVQIFEG